MCSIKIDVLPCFDRSSHKYSQHNYFINTLASSWNKYEVDYIALNASEQQSDIIKVTR